MVQFTATRIDNDKISVTGNVNATAVLAQLFGVTTIPVSLPVLPRKKKWRS